MADFTLTQTDSQVQSIINDAQDAMGAGAQTSLTTDYIMLKDTNGRYHKILKDSFTEAVRNVLAGLLVNNDKGTTVSQIPSIASGDFGSVTPANLASVLGANAIWSSIPQNTDLDNILAANSKYGMYCFHCSGASVSNTLSNKPSNIISTAFYLIVLKEFSDSFGYCTQIIVQSGKLWLRNNASSTWNAWKEVSSTALT